MAKELTLRDGTPAMLWPLSPTDAKGLAERYRGLSQQSRHSRFLTSVRDLSDGMLRRLVDDVDGREHVALLLFVFPTDGDDRAVGIGRLVHYENEPTAADVAVTVDEDWRGRGVATALLAELISRRPDGVDEILTLIAADNAASFAMLSRLGPMRTLPAGDGVYEVGVDVSGWPRTPATDPAGG